MLSPEFLAALPESVVALFLQVEEDLLEDIARRIAKMDGITDTAKWQAWRYEQVKLFSSNALQTLAAATGKSKEELVQLFREAALETLAADNDIYTAAGLTAPETLSPTLQNILQSGYLQTGQMMENFTATTANTVTRQFENALDRAWLQINTGGFTYQQAIRKAIQTLAQDGLSAIVYPSGHRDTIETAVRRAVLTGVNQTAAKLQIARMEETGCEFVEVTAHPGARPSHAVWQGKVFHIGGAVTVDGVYYPDFVTATGYGTGAGLGGWNCRHNFFPFFPGLSKRAYTDEMLAQLDAKEISYQGRDCTRYEARQIQRALERKIRRAKRESLALDAAGQDTAESAVKLRRARTQLNDFLTETGLRQDNFREQVAGFGRSAAARATALAQQQLMFQRLIDISKKAGKIEIDKAMEDFIASKSFEELRCFINKLPDRTVRKWYKAHDSIIPNMIDQTKPLEQQAHQAFELRNLHRTQARDLMFDQQKRKQLDISDPNKSFEELISDKMKRKGLSREEAVKDIINTATKTRKTVDISLGLG